MSTVLVNAKAEQVITIISGVPHANAEYKIKRRRFVILSSSPDDVDAEKKIIYKSKRKLKSSVITHRVSEPIIRKTQYVKHAKAKASEISHRTSNSFNTERK